MQKRSKEEVAIFVLSGLLFLAVIGLVHNLLVTMPDSDRTPTGYAVQTAPSQVVIQSYFSISKSDNLTGGIDFGTIANLPATDQNGTANYDGSNQTGYYISVSADSNVNVDFCIKADALNTSTGEEIGLGNYTWEDDTTNNASSPATGGTAITTSFVAGTTGVTPSSDNYYRFWLDVSAGQAPGTYNNTVSLEGVSTGSGCS